MRIIFLICFCFCIRAFSEEIQADSTGKIKTHYSSLPSPIETNEKEVLRALDQVGDSFFIENTGTLIEADFFSVPNYYFADFSITIDSIHEKDGKNLLKETFTKETNGTGFYQGIMSILNHRIHKLKRPSHSLQGQGKIGCRIPISFLNYSFTKKDIGKPVNIGNYRIILDYIEGNAAELKFKKKLPANIRYKFFDQTGKEILGDTLYSRYGEPGGFNYQILKALGNLVRVDVFLPVKTVDKTIDFKIHCWPGAQSEVKQPRYAPRRRGTFVKLTRGELEDKTKVVFKRIQPAPEWDDEAEADDGEPARVSVLLPECLNSKFAQISFENIELTDDRGKTSGFKIVRRTLGDFTASGLIDRLGRRKPIRFSKVSGLVRIKYPLKIETHECRIDVAPPKSIIIKKPNSISITTGATGVEIPSQTSHATQRLDAIRGFDKHNRRLKVILSPISYSAKRNPETGTSTEVLTHQRVFWGEVQRFEWDSVEEYTELQIPFSFKY